MQWQDPAIALAIFVITLTAIPMIRQNMTPPLTTSAPLVIGASVLVIAYASLGLWWSVLVEALAIVLWMILLARGLSATLQPNE